MTTYNPANVFYRVTPTEPDADITSYSFGDASDALDFIYETLAGEYGYAMDYVDIDGTRLLGFCHSVLDRRRAHGSTVCGGHLIGHIEIVETAWIPNEEDIKQANNGSDW